MLTAEGGWGQSRAWRAVLGLDVSRLEDPGRVAETC